MNRTIIAAIILPVLLPGCQEYELNTKPDPQVPPGDTAPPDTTTSYITPTEPTGTVDTVPTDTGTPPGCTDIPVSWSWLSPAPFPEEADPVDANGLVFYDPAHEALGWSAVVIPDRSTPVGNDRIYRSTITLPHLPPQLVVSLQSDDGIWLYVNGVQVAHFGGDWQEEGCVNENADCLVAERAPDLDLTDYLVVGDNVIAARVSNAIENSYFEVLPFCNE